MITVRQLKDLIARLPDDAVCHAYEGEVTGLVINSGADTQAAGWGQIGWIPMHCQGMQEPRLFTN